MRPWERSSFEKLNYVTARNDLFSLLVQLCDPFFASFPDAVVKENPGNHVVNRC